MRGPQATLTPKMKRCARAMYDMGKTQREIAGFYEVSYQAWRKRCVRANFTLGEPRFRPERRYLSAEQLAEAIRLRTEENLYNTKIAERLKIRYETFLLILLRDGIVLPHMRFKKNDTERGEAYRTGNKVQIPDCHGPGA